MAPRNEETLAGAIPLRLSDDQPVRDYVPREYVQSGRSVSSAEGEPPAPGPAPLFDPRAAADATIAARVAPAEATAGEGDELALSLVRYALSMANRPQRGMSATEGLLLKSAVLVVRELDRTLSAVLDAPFEETPAPPEPARDAPTPRKKGTRGRKA